MATTVDGLVSGLDTTTIISQLMQIAGRAADPAEDQLSTQQSALSALQSVNTKMASLQTAAEKLQQASDLGRGDRDVSSSSVTATAAAGALAGSHHLLGHPARRRRSPASARRPSAR